MNILVTGGSGFIGSHLVDILIENGYNVSIYDIETPQYKQVCKYVKGDVLDFNRLQKETKDIDFIYHLAAEANVNRFFDSPIYSNQITSLSTLNVPDFEYNLFLPLFPFQLKFPRCRISILSMLTILF